MHRPAHLQAGPTVKSDPSSTSSTSSATPTPQNSTAGQSRDHMLPHRADTWTSWVRSLVMPEYGTLPQPQSKQARRPVPAVPKNPPVR